MAERETLAFIIRHAFCCSSICQKLLELIDSDVIEGVSADTLGRGRVLVGRLIEPCAVGAAMYVLDFGPMASRYSKSIAGAPPDRLLHGLIGEYDQLVKRMTEWVTKIPPDKQFATFSTAYGSQAALVAQAFEQLQDAVFADLSETNDNAAAA